MKIAIAFATCLLLAACNGQPADQPGGEVSSLEQGKQQGLEAAAAAQNANTGNGDWWDVKAQWDLAIQTLEQVPPGDPDYAEAQDRIEGYKVSQDIAARRAVDGGGSNQRDVSGDYSTYQANAGLSQTTPVRWQWLEYGEFTCEYGNCVAIEVIPVEGCDRSLFVELALEDANGVNVGRANDSTGRVGAGQTARLIFNITEESVDKASVGDMSCY